MAIDDKTGVQMPGPSETESYAYGQDFRGLEIDMSVFSQQGSDMGGLSVHPPFPASPESQSSDGRGMFNDQASGIHPADAGGMDAMRGLASGAQRDATLVNEDVYLLQDPFAVPELPETADPLIVGEEQSALTDE